MRASLLQRTGAMAVAGGLLLISGTNPLTYGGTVAALQVVSVQQAGPTGGATVVNPGSDPIRARLVAEVSVNGKPGIVQVRFTVWGGQKVFVPLALPTPDAQIISVGVIVDDGAPI